jgi:hypothetical protein
MLAINRIPTRLQLGFGIALILQRHEIQGEPSMKIVSEPSPPPLEDEIKRGFTCNIPEATFFSSLIPLPQALSELPLSRIPPHKQFTMLFEDLEASADRSNPLDHAILVGWRFFEWTNDGLAGARLVWTLETIPEQSGLIYFNIGRYVLGSVTGFQAAEALPNEASYYFRVLALPQIYIFAIWLRLADGGDAEPPDLLMPINPAPDLGGAPPEISPFEPLVPYTANAFFERAREFLQEARDCAPRPDTLQNFGETGN